MAAGVEFCVWYAGTPVTVTAGANSFLEIMSIEKVIGRRSEMSIEDKVLLAPVSRRNRDEE